MSGRFTGTFKPIHRRFRGEKRGEAALVGVDHEGAGTTMKPVPARAFSLSASLAKHTGAQGASASPSKYAHVSNVHFNHRSHRPSRAIAPSPLSPFSLSFLSPLISRFFSGENLSSAERFHSVQHTPRAT